jgi:glutamine---fructose-6-phosphate transaminase (isomerizing)
VHTVLARYASRGACPVAITNDPASPLAEAAEVVLELGTGPEASVPATKTFTAQLVAFALIAEALDWGGGFAAAHWRAIPEVVRQVLSDQEPAERAAARLDASDGIACVARGYLLCVALEAALKLREAARVRAEGWSAADFRHGPVTLAGADLPLLAISVPGPAAEDVAELADLLAGRGSEVLRLDAAPGSDLPLPSTLPEPLAVVPAAVRAQQLALALATRRGVDPDNPPGLAKVTPTV